MKRLIIWKIDSTSIFCQAALKGKTYNPANDFDRVSGDNTVQLNTGKEVRCGNQQYMYWHAKNNIRKRMTLQQTIITKFIMTHSWLSWNIELVVQTAWYRRISWSVSAAQLDLNIIHRQAVPYQLTRERLKKCPAPKHSEIRRFRETIASSEIQFYTSLAWKLMENIIIRHEQTIPRRSSCSSWRYI